MARSVTVTLDISADGVVTLRDQAPGPPEVTPPPPQPPPVETPAAGDYASRGGYDPDFLAGGGVAISVPLPTLPKALEDLAAKFLDGSGGCVLTYDAYSAVVHAARRLAFYTAANVDGGNRFQLGRPPDRWRFDPRIAADAQLDNFYYANNKFDRGHLTRREDMEFGDTPAAATARADDTFHWTNCTPQHSGFNQSRELWQGLERHILEGSLQANRFAAQVITGPVLDAGDPVWERFPDIQYPARFWKIAAALTSQNRLFAAGFILDQTAVIAAEGIRAVEVPFAGFKTFQVPITEIERLSGLGFTYVENGATHALSEVDPLNGAEGRRIAQAASVGVDVPPGYVLLESAASIIR